MPNDSFSQQALANDARFRQRIKAALATVAWQVLGEDVNAPNHTQRANYARGVLTNLDTITAQIAPWMVMRTNVIAFATTYDFSLSAVVSATGDADLQSQISTDWNHLAGV